MPGRYIREGIIRSKRICSMSEGAQLFYHKLLNVVDDYGRFESSPMCLFSAVYPVLCNTISEDEQIEYLKNVQRYRTECAERFLIHLYGEKNQYLQVANFCQRRGKSKFPAPPDEVDAILHYGFIDDQQHRAMVLQLLQKGGVAAVERYFNERLMNDKRPLNGCQTTVKQPSNGRKTTAKQTFDLNVNGNVNENEGSRAGAHAGASGAEATPTDPHTPADESGVPGSEPGIGDIPPSCRPVAAPCTIDQVKILFHNCFAGDEWDGVDRHAIAEEWYANMTDERWQSIGRRPWAASAKRFARMVRADKRFQMAAAGGGSYPSSGAAGDAPGAPAGRAAKMAVIMCTACRGNVDEGGCTCQPAPEDVLKHRHKHYRQYWRNSGEKNEDFVARIFASPAAKK